MTIFGENFFQTPYLNCRFGTLATTAATFISETQIECETPAVGDPNLDYEISITLNGIEYFFFLIDDTPQLFQ